MSLHNVKPHIPDRSVQLVCKPLLLPLFIQVREIDLDERRVFDVCCRCEGGMGVGGDGGSLWH